MLNSVGIGRRVVMNGREANGTSHEAFGSEGGQRPVGLLEGRRRMGKEGQGVPVSLVQGQKGNPLLGEQRGDSLLERRHQGGKGRLVARVKGGAGGVGVVVKKLKRGGQNTHVFKFGIGEAGPVAFVEGSEVEKGGAQGGVRQNGEHLEGHPLGSLGLS